ncbi:MAG: hypothetical protein RLP44_15710 [Aggregatilineales bacterium]
MHQIRWYNTDQTIIICEFDEPLTWEAFHHGIDAMHQAIRTKDDAVIAIIVPQGDLPKGNPITQFRSAANRQPKNLARIIAVNPNLDTPTGKFILILTSVLEKITRDKVMLTETLEKAVEAATIELKKVSTPNAP